MTNIQGDFPLPTPKSNNKRTASEFLPRFFRTEANQKFLQATIDQLIQPGVAEKVDGYFGRKTAKAFKNTDNYISDVSSPRQDRQLEPSLVIKDDLENVTFYKDYNDYINQLEYFSTDVSDHSQINTQESYVWDPHIDWDKFVNFREYFWLPNGPSTVPVRGQSREVISTYTVTIEDQGDNVAYVFGSNLERNPTLKLYRGQKYRFEIDTPGHPIAFAVTRSFTPGNAVIVAGKEGLKGPGLYDATLYGNEYDIGDYIILPFSGSVSFEDDDNVSTLFNDGVRKLGEEGEEIANVYVERGIIEFTIPLNAPSNLYYISKNDIDTSGLINIYDIEENSLLDVEKEILGKKTYLSANGVSLSNGMKIEFQGDTIPNTYEQGKYYVEGVGSSIVLVPEVSLTISEGFSGLDLVNFDKEGFDTLPFDNSSFFPREKDYTTINRASRDGNAWSRYNRWFHRSVIEKSLEYVQLPVTVDETLRAKRPIIEFEANLKLFNYGTKSKKDIDLVDNFTKDVFSEIEGSLGYIVDGVNLADGMRILFTADTDILVNGKIYEVNFIVSGNDRQISLLEVQDSLPLENETVLVTQGKQNGGKIYSYNGRTWKLSQQRTTQNQPPLFDLCCPEGNFFSDLLVFDSSTFHGTKLFSYKIGEGINDSELGFPIFYKNIDNTGDILFEFNLLVDRFTIQTNEGISDVSTSIGNLRRYKNRTDFDYVNGWSSKPIKTKQRVLRQYVSNNNQNNNFEIDVYDRAGDLNSLKVIVYVNNKLKRQLKDYEIDRVGGKAFVRFYNNLDTNDIVLLKTDSEVEKNQNGWYEFPLNLERNPLNEDISDFTLGEVVDHVDTMIESLAEFEGVYPGTSNLRDLGNIDRYGRRFLKHTGPLNLAIYHITNKKYNIIKALEYSKFEYSKFKRNFFSIASELGYDGPIKNHVDLILKEVNKDKIKSQPFYFSDMTAYTGAKKIEYEILDSNNEFYALTEPFSLDELTNKQVSVYLNGVQLIYKKHYTFSNQGFLVLQAGQKEADILEIYEYISTDGSFIPPTPTKLGLYPKYEPHLTIDDTYVTTNDLIFENVPYLTTSNGSEAVFDIKNTNNISNYIVTIVNNGIKYSENDQFIVKGSNLNGEDIVNDCVITVESVTKNGSIRAISVKGISPEIDLIGPYKIYGELEDENVRGWFYPIYLRKSVAADKDTSSKTVTLKFRGLNKIFYAPESAIKYGAQDDQELNEYPYGVTMIRGHDGSYTRAWKDYRDNLLLELEKRIFNNIKVEYDDQDLNIHDFVGGKFRNTGVDTEKINKTLLKDFIDWNKIVKKNYTDNDFFDRANHFTFNYSSMTSAIDGKSLPGYWRAVYKQVFDTDRPHTHPWEMIGFSIKPQWWDTVYGPAPYTSNNLILWEDIENGIIREPGKQPRVDTRYARGGIFNFIPVDAQGQLKTPIDSGYAQNYFFRNTDSDFNFGDESPVETAWRRSSDYPFALIKSWVLNQPAKILGNGFDLSRKIKNLSGQTVYKETLKNIEIDKILLPNSYEDDQRVITSGLVNYLYNLVASNILSIYDDYKNDLSRITNQLGIKIGGFSDKNKFRLVLDSKSPSSTNSNIFVPDENYHLFLNTSSPIGSTVIYSAITVEKTPSGFIISGYNNDSPKFKFYRHLENSSDIVVTIGGIAEVTTEWQSNREYTKGQIVENNFKYYRVIESFTSENIFDTKNLGLLPELPIVGGRRAIFRRNFEKREVAELNYGTKLRNIQDVVDFILGYGEWLKDQGFDFNYFNKETGYVENWDHSAKEFLFWTTQGWSAGSTISMSPSASEVDFSSRYAVVDDIYDLFYDYSLLKSDGQPLERQFSSIFRDENNFGIRPKKTVDGIYNIKLPLVQKEHVVLIDNETVFNDVIYHPSSGYRIDRIRVLGYRSDNWQGGLNIPGFVYDDAKTDDWQPWQDYKIGSLVKHKQFYYVAVFPVPGNSDFEPKYWQRLSEKPEPELIANFDYKINQISDFYDLDSDNFDAEQQKLAQHIIGYQKREYLANIINDDISQYKFYQGFIQEKGTKNSIDKLFKSLNSNNGEDLDFYEEWAIQTGRYGASDTVKQVEYILNERLMQTSPQAFSLVDRYSKNNFNKTYEVLPSDAYEAPLEYNHKPFPLTESNNEPFARGYVHDDDVNYQISNISELETIDTSLLNNGDYIWLADLDPISWNVFQIQSSESKTVSFENTLELTEDNQKRIYKITTDKWVITNFSAGEIVGIKGAIQGMFKINSVNANYINIEVPININLNDFEDEYTLIKLREVRVETLSQLSSLVQNKLTLGQKVWIDNYTDKKWAVLENQKTFNLNQTISNDSEDDLSTYYGYAEDMSVSNSNNDLMIGAPYLESGQVHYYRRSQEKNNLLLDTVITPPLQLFERDGSLFGNSVSISEDGKFLAVGIPNAGSIKTKYKGIFNPSDNYQADDIVKYRESLWRANKDIFSGLQQIEYNTHNSYYNIVQDEASAFNLIVTGAAGLENKYVDHFLVKATESMYNATEVGDTVKLKWNIKTFNHLDIQTTDEREPFDGSLDLSANIITDTHTIEAKVDAVILLKNINLLLSPDDTLVTGRSSSVVERFIRYDNENNAVVYVKDLKGILDRTGELFVLNNTTNQSIFVADYEVVNYDRAESLSGYWVFNTVIGYDNGSNFIEKGTGLVYEDIKRAADDFRQDYYYYNIQDQIAITNRPESSFITGLSYFGNPLGGESSDQLSDLWVIRTTPEHTNNISVTDVSKVKLFNRSIKVIDFSTIGLGDSFENDVERTIEDIWDGYIDFEYTNFDAQGNSFDILPGDRIGIIFRKPDAINLNVPLQIDPSQAYEANVSEKADVVFVQRQFNNVRIYLKNVEGNWNLRNNTLQVDVLRFDAPTITRTAGIITSLNFSTGLSISDSEIGKLLVFRNSSPLPIVEDSELFGWEYEFYTNDTNREGAVLQVNSPNDLNKDYTQVFNIIADSTGYSGNENEGAVAIYRKIPGSTFTLDRVITSELIVNENNQRLQNRRFGKKVRIVKNEDQYILLVSSQEDLDSTDFRGKIEIFRHGPLKTESYKGPWSDIEQYSTGDVVYYRENFYKAVTEILAGTSIDDEIAWVNISWRTSKDTRYRGIWGSEFDSTLSQSFGFTRGSIVSYSLPSENGLREEDSLWIAKTNTLPGDFKLTNWNKVTESVDYVGYIPNLTDKNFFNDQKIDFIDTIQEFAEDFEVSKDGSVIIIKTKLISDNATKFLIYRMLGNYYSLSQVIDNITFGKNDSIKIAINKAGTKIAISDPYNDDIKKDQGKVYVFKSNQIGNFELDQTIYSPNNELTEGFGYNISFSNDILAVSSKNGNQSFPTTFDSDTTTFDLRFTEFKNTKYDVGIVYIYEENSDKLIYAEDLTYKNVTNSFGESMLVSSNHIYLGLPQYKNNSKEGAVLDYRRNKNTKSWKVLREQVKPVDVDKIQTVFLYNRKTNKILTYLDIIDPVRGKIAGIADQNLDYKTPYDPAFYNTGSVSEKINNDIYWAQEQKNKIWWNTSRAKFKYSYFGDIQYQKENWNQLQSGSSIDICEWVESDIIPSEWDRIADTEDGLNRGISGRSLYGNNLYSTTFVYDEISQRFVERYYFWVLNTRVKTNGRSVSAFEISKLIERPRQEGYRFISFLGEDRFLLNNCNSLIYDSDIVLHISYITGNEVQNNVHSVYQILSDGDKNSIPDKRIERKWFDSLIGFDKQQRRVPDVNLTPKQRYGVQDSPRQSMFINKVEALKQVVERINQVLKNNIVVDNYDISMLFDLDPMPTLASKRFDVVVNTIDELRFISTSKITEAKLEPVIVNGKLERVKIINPGRGYKIAPSYEIDGEGKNAEISLEINNLGQVTNVNIIKKGSQYTENTRITVRKFSVLVQNDETINRRWSIQEWDAEDQSWFRKSIQSYDVTRYWNYANWYAPGFSEFTFIDFSIDGTYELDSINDNNGDVIRVENVGAGGWLLLEKYNSIDTDDYTQNYRVVGRENGTIQLRSDLYDFSKNSTGFDNRSFDSFYYDTDSSIELRKILETIRDKIFIGNLKIEYNQLFISSLRYILSEQLYVDWVFKTSFLKIKYKDGELEQKINYQQNKIESYRSYIEEVKPYKSVIRELVTVYDKTDNTNSTVTDFDLAPAYDEFYKEIRPSSATITNSQLSNLNENAQQYPRRWWLDNYGYSVKEIKLGNPGSKYTIKPIIKIEGDGHGATAEAYLGFDGSISSIRIINPGRGYKKTPNIIIEGSQAEGGIQATATAILGNSVVRTLSVNLRFDRTSGKYYILNLLEQENFVGTNANFNFDLKWPMDLRNNTVTVTVNGREMLRSEYTYSNIKNSKSGYTRSQGQIQFTRPPALNSEIVVSYKKDISMLSAEDRILHAYNPTDGQLGSELSQLIEGVDYGGVQINGFEFGQSKGWDTEDWFGGRWDEFDESFEDYVFEFDGSTIAVDLDTPLETDVIYNVYLNGQRIDDPNYNTPEQTNDDARILSIVGDGIKTILDLDELGIKVQDGDTLIIRKITSDGSFLPKLDAYDTLLTGGDLAYNSATGLKAEDIIVDGDGFVTATTSKGTDELVPGQVMDTLDIQVYTKLDDSTEYVFRQFKDMLNRTHFKRIDSAATQLAQDLNYYDLRIEVVDGSKLPEPDKMRNRPGIIWINSERIEYLVKDGNTLRQLRRGTLGTGAKTVHETGSEIYDQGTSKNIPYKDQMYVQTVQKMPSSQTEINLEFISKSVNEFEVFVNGRRLRKEIKNQFNPTLALDSPEGDTILEPEFTFDSLDNKITIKTDLAEENTVHIVRKVGKIWANIGESITTSNTEISRFLRQRT